MKTHILAGAIAATLVAPAAVAEVMASGSARLLSSAELDSVTAGVISATSAASAGAVSPLVAITHTETLTTVYNDASSAGYSQLDSSLAVGSSLGVAYGGVSGTESTGANVTVSAPGAQTVGFAQTTNYQGTLFSVSRVTAWEAGLPVNMATK